MKMWTEHEMTEYAKRVRRMHYNGNNTSALDAIEALPPSVAAYVGAYVLGAIDIFDSQDRWMRQLQLRAEQQPRKESVHEQET